MTASRACRPGGPPLLQGLALPVAVGRVGGAGAEPHEHHLGDGVALGRLAGVEDGGGRVGCTGTPELSQTVSSAGRWHN